MDHPILCEGGRHARAARRLPRFRLAKRPEPRAQLVHEKFELKDKQSVEALANTIAARLKDSLITEETGPSSKD